MQDETLAAIAARAEELGGFDVYNVRVPDGGFLAVVWKGSRLNPSACDRMTKQLHEIAKCKVVVFDGDVTLVGVGPESKAE